MVKRSLVPATPDRSPAGRAAYRADLQARLLAKAAEAETAGDADRAEFWRDLARDDR